MQVIALVGNKGGAGKTTLAINLASAFNELAPTVLLDADPQGSSLQWFNIAGDDCVLNVADASIGVEDQVRSAEDVSYCVVDCPPSVHSDQTRDALRVSDLVIIPVQPSPLDLWASVHIETEVNKARKVNPGLRALLVINQSEPRTRLSRLAADALQELSLPAASTAIRRRVAHRNAILQGRSVLQMGSRGAAAADEIRQLIDELKIYMET
ncbi:MAG: ParA family partition ATPase [Gammaproteobacteria bacterium]|jgi:chromosome partitioning protein